MFHKVHKSGLAHSTLWKDTCEWVLYEWTLLFVVKTKDGGEFESIELFGIYELAMAHSALWKDTCEWVLYEWTLLFVVKTKDGGEF